MIVVERFDRSWRDGVLYRLAPLYDVMSAAPYPQFPPQKIKLAMAIGDRKYYRLRQIQIRHFYQTGKKAGLREADMDGILSGLTSRVEEVLICIQI